MKPATFLLLSFAVTSLLATDYSYTLPKDTQISSIEEKAFIDSLPKNIVVDKKSLKKTLQRNRLFTKAYLENSKLTKEQKALLNLAVEEKIASFYIDKLKKENEPDHLAIKSFYLDHYEEFKPIEKVSVKSLTFKSLAEADKAYLKMKDAKDKQKFFKEATTFDSVAITLFSPEIREWIREHKEGEISKPFKVNNKYVIDYIVKKEKTKVSFENLSEEMKNILTNVYMHQGIDKEYERLRKKEGVK